jgi:hypothetical protein
MVMYSAILFLFFIFIENLKIPKDKLITMGA